jgi:hypothetical protein
MAARSATSLRDRFLGWQCRIRQIAMRQDGGRPSPGMRPRVTTAEGRVVAPALTLLLVRNQPAESTAFFRFQVRKSLEPRDAYEKGLAFLQADFFQDPGAFSDGLAAVLPHDSPVAAELKEAKTCILEFDQFAQKFRLPCTVRELDAGDAVREAALWHNRLFNPLLPDSARVFAFHADWKSASAEP